MAVENKSVSKPNVDLSNKKVAVLGAGKLGGMLLQALMREGLLSKESTRATVRHPERVAALAEKLGIKVGTDNATAVRGANIIFICVKPQTVDEVVKEIRAHVAPGALVISVAASVSTSQIESVLGTRTAVIRAMPNTPCALGAGMTGLCKGKYVTAEEIALACSLFDVVGRTVVVDEKHMDAVTGLSASGPAFIYIILESLAEAGVKVGLPREVATLLAAQMTMGSAKMVLETGDHPAQLKDSVTTPAGCTIDGILELEEGKLRVTLIKAVVKATQRAKELASSA
ncbi:MAG: pyrroline-5-carboxylate reductase [Candidatus Sulfotelmatobacter sp.]|jgi:pyrroline-5-carboxylate reductase